jgi:glycine hydroxymethyltransferase
MKEEQMRVIGQVMADVLTHPEDEAVIADCNKRIAELCRQFPLYPEIE